MESLNDKITEFLTLSNGGDCGSGDGWGDVWGDGSGYGWGGGSDCGRGYGWGDGSGSVYGSGDGRGGGYGSGAGSGIKEFIGAPVTIIDDTPTLIRYIRGNVAYGAFLHDDLTTEECFVAKQDNTFAHGRTLREAMEALREKLFADMPQEERIAAFISEHPIGEAYPCRDLYDWHHRLTGSCEMGRNAFAKDHGIDVEHDTMTVERFIKLTRNAYGGDVIRALERAYKEG